MARRILAVVVVAILGLTAGHDTGAPAAPSPESCGASSGAGSTQTRPVVLVHGWTSKPSKMAAVKQSLNNRLRGRVTTYSFDYSLHANNWAGDPEVAGCLAQYLVAVSAAHRGQ